jgi:GNAT superfamily N-acetyltransferase
VTAPVGLHRLGAEELTAASRVHRAAFDAALPWLAGMHTPEGDARFWRDRVAPSCRIWGAGNPGALFGVIAVSQGWVEHLYVLPAAQGRGLGSSLLATAKAEEPELLLWAFQRNARARAFYERRGFRLVRETDGADNEEREPDALYRWQRDGDGNDGEA